MSLKHYTNRQLRRALGKFSTVETEVDLGAQLVLRITEVEDAYALLDRMVAQEARQGPRAERFPYWAEIWPSSVGLARWFCEQGLEAPAGGVRELGCGLGLVGVALARLGWRVEATDFVETALVFATHNARANQAETHHGTAYLDWRHPAGLPVSCLVAADVVYERQNHAYLNGVLQYLLLPGGRFFLADPQRPAARHFVVLLEEQGYEHQVETRPVRWKSLEHRLDIHTFTKPQQRFHPPRVGFSNGP